MSQSSPLPHQAAGIKAIADDSRVIQPEDVGYAGAMVAQTPIQDASLARMGLTAMTPDMRRRFFTKCRKVDLGHKVNGEPSECWVWIGGSHPKGYGRFYLGKIDGKKVLAYSHRISYEHHVGPVPDGDVVDHECNNKACCNPAHLTPINDLENLRLAAERRPWKRHNQYTGSEGVRTDPKEY